MDEAEGLSEENHERTSSGETWMGVPVAAYLWDEPTNLDPPSSQTFDRVAFHWSTGPAHAERLYRESDVRRLLNAARAESRSTPDREGVELTELAAHGTADKPIGSHEWTVAVTVLADRAKVAIARPASSAGEPRPTKMLVDQAWLDRHVAADPDSDAEAGSAGGVEEARQEVIDAAHALVMEPGGLRCTPSALIVVERADKSDPHYRLCTAFERLAALTSKGADRG